MSKPTTLCSYGGMNDFVGVNALMWVVFEGLYCIHCVGNMGVWVWGVMFYNASVWWILGLCTRLHLSYFVFLGVCLGYDGLGRECHIVWYVWSYCDY